MKPLISFITINYNSTKYTLNLLKSIEKHTSLNYEIIIIDNNSTQEQIDHLEQKYSSYKHTTLIKNPINCGFACANNIASKKAHGEYLFFINNDTKLLNDATLYFYNFIQKEKNCALLTAQLIDENKEFASSYKLFPSLTKELFGNTLARAFNKYPSNKIHLTQPTKVEVITGACMFFKQDVFNELQGLDEQFFLYCEEEDVSKRVRKLGYEIYFLPESHIFHKGGGSAEQSYDLLKEYYISYNYLIFKHFNKIQASILYTLMSLKIFRRSLRKKHYKKLLALAIKGFDETQSLRHKQ